MKQKILKFEMTYTKWCIKINLLVKRDLKNCLENIIILLVRNIIVILYLMIRSLTI